VRSARKRFPLEAKLSSMRPHERLLKWFKLKGPDEMFDAVFSADAELDDLFGVHRLRNYLWAGHGYEDVRPIVVQGDDGGGGVVLEALHAYTGTWRRIAWVFSVRNGLITKVTETLSAPFNREDVDRANGGLETERLIVEFKLRRITAANRAGYEATVRAVLASVQENHPDWPPPEKCGFFGDHPFEANSWWFVPFCWIGCIGHIVDKASGRVVELVSEAVHSLDLSFWAHERGALEMPCTLVIDKVHDIARARELVAKLDVRGTYFPEDFPIQRRASDGSPRWLNPEALLARVPVRVEAECLWFALATLREAEVTHAFDFHIESAAASPDLG
jgi:hypothetical protein